MPHYTPGIEELGIISKQILNKTLTELPYVKKTLFLEDVDTPNLWIFDLGSQRRVIVPVWIIVGFEERTRSNQHFLNIDTFCRPPVSSA